MNPSLEIFSQGEEIVTGQVVDANAAWLSQKAVELGFDVTRHTAVGDRLDDLIALLKEISNRADCCICTGGLGPTSDDLTAEAVSIAFDMPLELNEAALQKIERFFADRNRIMPKVNRKQALLPKGSLWLDNDWGTAPGFALQKDKCWFAFAPGVPSEMQALFSHRILPLLNGRFSLKPNTLLTIKTLGLGESLIQERVNGIRLPEPVQIGFCANSMEVQTKLLFPFDYPRIEMLGLLESFKQVLGDSVFAVDGLEDASSDLISMIDALMAKGQHKLSVLESASHGLLSSLCIGKDWLIEARIEPCKRLQGSDDPQALAKKKIGEMKGEADCYLVQFYQGDLNDQSQAVSLYNALLTQQGFYQTRHSLTGSAQRKQNQAAAWSLDLLRRSL